MSSQRAVSPVIGTILMVAIVVVLAATIGVVFLDIAEDGMSPNEQAIPVSDEFLLNGGFEDGHLDPWRGYGIASGEYVTTTEPYRGRYALEVGDDRHDEESEIYVAQETTRMNERGTYRLCAHSTATDSDSGVWIGVQYYDDEDFDSAEIIEKATYEVTWTDYREECVITELPDEEVQGAEVWVYYEADTGSGTVHVDDVSLRQVRYFVEDGRETDKE